MGADLWAVGVMLFEMIAGHPYFQAESGPKLDHLIRSYNRVLPLPDTLPPTLRNILERALTLIRGCATRPLHNLRGDMQAFRNGESVAGPPIRKPRAECPE